MIALSIQIKMLFFSFIFGFFFSIILDIFNNKIKKCKNYVKLILSFFIVFFSTIVYFKGIYIIGNSIFHVYSIITIIVGFFSYDIINRLIVNSKKK